MEVLLNKFHRGEKGEDVEGGFKGMIVQVSHRIQAGSEWEWNQEGMMEDE